MNSYTVSFFGHRKIDDFYHTERQINQIIENLLSIHSHVEFLVGRNGDFDQIVSSAIHRYKRLIRDDNSVLIWVMPYITANYKVNEDSFRTYYDEIEVCNDSSSVHFKKAFQIRNRKMVDRSDFIVFYVNRSSGGAFQTMQYAAQNDKKYINIFEERII